MPRPAPDGLAIASLALGVAAIVLSPLLLGGLLGVVGVVLGILYVRSRGPERLMAWWGAALSIASVLVTVVFGWAYVWLFQNLAHEGNRASREHPAWQGQPAPAMILTALDGERLDLAAFRGRPVVLSFWATWCGACREEIPNLNRFAQEFDRSRVLLIGISDEDRGTLETFARRQRVAYPLVSVASYPSPFDDIGSLPTAVFIDRNGVIRQVHVGYLTFEELRASAFAPEGPAAVGGGGSADTPPTVR